MNASPFVDALVRSETFWSGPASYAGCALVCFAIAVSFALWRWRARPHAGPHGSVRLSLRHDTAGAAAAVDFVLTIPILMLAVLLAVQFALLANGALLVHYAAYSAARSARVFLFDTSSSDYAHIACRGGLVSRSAATQLCNPLLLASINGGRAAQEARDAARLALISISPARRGLDSQPQASQETWNALDKLLRRNGRTPGASPYATFMRKARYAFDEEHTVVEVGLDASLRSSLGVALGNASLTEVSALPVYGRVTHQFYLNLPVAVLFGTRTDAGFFTRSLTAEVVLL